MSNDLIIVKVDRARALLAEARNVTDAKQVADMARAAEVYARRQRLSEETIAYATTIKVDAMTRMGEFLKSATKNKGANGVVFTGSRMEPVKDDTPTLKSVGVSKKESSTAQALADLKESEPGLHEKIRSGEKTVAQAVRAARRKKKELHLKERAAAAPEPGAATWEIVTGDCLAELPTLIPASVRLAFADPPYNFGFDYGRGKEADRLPREEYLAWCARWMKAVVPALTEDGSFWVLTPDENAAEFKLSLTASGLHIRQWLIWYETFGVNNGNGFNRTHRHLFWCVKDRKRFVFHGDAVSRPSDRQVKYDDPRADPGGKTWDSVWGVNPPIPRLVDNAKERLPGFPTQLPLALLTPIVACASEPGDLVCDLFAGSGSLGEAALRQGRRFVGFELNESYADKARLRLRAVKGELP